MAEIKYDRRSELLRTHTVPMLQETQQFLGHTLGNIVLHTMSPVAQRLMGVTKPLSTPPEHMWIAPQNHLDGNVVLTQPPSNDCLKAFTHQTIIRLGADIEQKVQHERAIAIEQAITETELFEQFECQQRLDFAVREEEAKQLLERERERNDLVAMFQDERDLLIEQQTAAVEALTQSLTQKCQQETDLRVAAEVARVERECMEIECKWRVEEMVLRVFIDHAQKVQESAVTEAKNDYFKVFQKLYNSFMMELQEQRDEMYSKHLAELMHVVTVEKSFAADKCHTIKSDMSRKIENLQSKITELRSEQSDPKASPKPCPNRLKIRNILRGFLRQYEKFVQWSVKDKNEQSQYFIPIQKYMQELQLEDEHPTGYYQCCSSCVPGPEADKKPNLDSTNDAVVADMEFADKKEKDRAPKDIVFVEACEVKREDSLPDIPRKPSVVSSSLSCFDFDGMIYASNKHYAKIVERLFPDQISLNAEWTEESKEIVLNSESYLDVVEQQLQHKVSQAVTHIICDLEASGICADPALDAVLHRHLDRVLRAAHEPLYSSTRSPPNNDTDALKVSEPSKLLSVADSLELYPVISTDSEESVVSPSVDAETQCELLLLQPKTTSTSTIGTKEQQAETRRGGRKHLEIQTDEYLRSLQSVPPYMRSTRTSNSRPSTIWDYRVTSDAEWSDLLAMVETMKSVDSNKHVRMAEKATAIEPRTSPAIMQQTNRNKRSESDRPQENIQNIMHVDRRTDGRWNDVTVAQLFQRMEDDGEICQWMKSRSVVEELPTSD